MKFECSRYASREYPPKRGGGTYPLYHVEFGRLVFAVAYGTGAPEGIRTPDPQIRSLVLYPAELPAHALHLSQSGPIKPPAHCGSV
jgi:hypothetical protein